MNKRKRSLTLFIGLLLLLLMAQTAAAHPLGNFTVSRYSRLAIEPAEVHLLYVVDMAEIPAFQERQLIDANGDGDISPPEQAQYLQAQSAQLAQNLHLVLNGKAVDWRRQTSDLTFPPGQADLPTLRLEITLTAVLPPANALWQAEYRDENYPGRLGWQEIVVQADSGIQLLASSVPQQDATDALRQYPADLLAAPLAVNSARFQFAPAGLAAEAASMDTAVAGTQPANGANAENRSGRDAFASLLTRTLDTPGAIAAALLLAAGLGAAHALTPGHGKTIVGAYLVGSRGTIKHALFLGLTTTVTHTAGVFGLGLLVLFASRTILPERLYPWLGVASGLLVVLIGVSLCRQRLLARHDNEVDEAGYHTHFGVRHKHTVAQNQVGWRNLLALGVSGGLLPCPSALILLLSAIAWQQVGFGLVLIVAFSAGLASVLTGIGLMLVYAGRLFARLPLGHGRVTRLLPVASALFITVAGLGITIKALLETGLV